MILPLLLLTAPLCAPQSVAVERADDVVIRSDEGDFTRGELAAWLLPMRGEALAPRFADMWLYAREARRLGLPDVAEDARAQVETEIQERIRMAYGGREQGWLDELAGARRTPAGRRAERLREVVRDMNLRSLAAHERVVPEEKVVRDWERAYGRDGRRFRVRLLFRRVVMPPMGGLTRDEQIAERERVIAEKRAELGELRARALAGESFAALARTHSDDAATRGGGGRPDDGFLDARGWPPEAVDALAQLSSGGVSEPVFVMGGLWLVQLEELVETPLEEVQDEILARLVERGPESDELSEARRRIVEGVAVEVLPAMRARPGPGETLPADVPVLRIDGTDVSRGEYAEYLFDALGDGAAPRFVEETRIERMAAEAGVEPTPADIEARVDKESQDLIDFFHRGDRERWEQETARVHGSVEAWRHSARSLRRLDLLIEGLILRERDVTEEIVRQTWRARYGEDGRSLHLRMIRIDAVPPELPEGVTPEEAERASQEALAEARTRAHEVAERAAQGEDFAALAKRHTSDDATRDVGGELPLGFEVGTLPPDVGAAVEELKPGEVSGALEAGVSWFVFELLAVRDVPYEEVADDLRRELLTAAPSNVETRGFYNVATRDLSIEVLPALFE
jgi:parvulin-like peptidyl-prolyl isomerase